jgi:hypothetical protein
VAGRGAGLGEALDQHDTRVPAHRLRQGLWAKQADIWSDDPAEQKKIANRLGWLESPELMTKNLPRLLRFADRVRRDGVTHVLLLGMGGSSLAPEVMRAILAGGTPGAPVLTMLDSTDPAAVKAVADSLPLAKTLVIVASKSGTTIEPNVLSAYVQERMRAAGVKEPARQLVAITDEGTGMHSWPREVPRIFANPRRSAATRPCYRHGRPRRARRLGSWPGAAVACGPGNAISQNPGVAWGSSWGRRSGRPS